MNDLFNLDALDAWERSELLLDLFVKDDTDPIVRQLAAQYFTEAVNYDHLFEYINAQLAFDNISPRSRAVREYKRIRNIIIQYPLHPDVKQLIEKSDAWIAGGCIGE